MLLIRFFACFWVVCIPFVLHAQDLTIQVDFTAEQSIKGYSKAVQGKRSLKMTLAVIHFENAETLNQLRSSLLNDIRKSSKIQTNLKAFALRFLGFELLGGNLVANYGPVDPKMGSATSQAKQAYNNVIGEINHLVRRSVKQDAKGKKFLKRTTPQKVEEVKVGGEVVYKASVKPSQPYITLKHKANQKDFDTVKIHYDSMRRIRPADLKITINDIAIASDK